MTIPHVDDGTTERSEAPSNHSLTEDSINSLTSASPSNSTATRESISRASAPPQRSGKATEQLSTDVPPAVVPDEFAVVPPTPSESKVTTGTKIPGVATITERAEVTSDLGSTQESGAITTVPASSEQKPRPKSQLWHHALTTDVLDKQYRLYSWNDAKSLSLITTNSVLLAAIGFLFKECLPDTFSLLAILMALVLVASSLYFSLKQVIPQGSSGKSGLTPNVRALSGITKFETWESYHTRLLEMDEEESFECAARQIYGMALNNDVSRRTTTRGVRLTLFGILFIVLSTVGVALSARDMHILGQWVTKGPEASQKLDRAPINAIGSGNGAEAASKSSASVADPSPTVAQPSPSKGSPPKSNR